MIDVDPLTLLDQQHTMSGLTVSQVTRTEDKGKQGVKGDTCFNNCCFNNYHLSTGQRVAISSELENRTSITGKTWQTVSADMPGKFDAGKTGVHRTPTREGFRFGNTSGIF